MMQFQERLSEVRAQLRIATAAGAPPVSKDRVGALHREVVIALEEFGRQSDGSRGQSWEILAGSAAKHLAHAAEMPTTDASYAELAEAETKLAIILADMNS